MEPGFLFAQSVTEDSTEISTLLMLATWKTASLPARLALLVSLQTFPTILMPNVKFALLDSSRINLQVPHALHVPQGIAQ
jgi:hypothetical protein